MNSSERHIYVKKRLMFDKEDDYYFITYNLIVFLTVLECFNEDKKLVDYTKIAYLIPFISNPMLLNIFSAFQEIGREPPFEERNLLTDAYLRARLRRNLLSSIVVALEQREVVHLSKNQKRGTIDIWLGNVPEPLQDMDLFELEVKNSRAIKRLIPRLRTLKTQTTLERLYGDMGVQVWDD